jgi:bifunctional non-homologous end joining protein LigD
VPAAATVSIDGRTLRLSNLDKVLYPEAGFTKAEVIDYYARISPALLTHSAGRAMSLRRFPDGVDGESFFEKRCPSYRPEWMATYPGPGDHVGEIRYCGIDDVASLVWLANLAALELHAPMARGTDLESPHMVVFDLDPGPGVGIPECARVALDIREVLDGLGLESVVKTSGSKGLQAYVPLNVDGHTHAGTAAFAQAVAQLLEKRDPKRVTSVMRKDLRGGKVFIDWSQNSRHKTTVCAYSLRARPRPTVSTPVTWDEAEAAARGKDPLVFEAADVLDRVDELGDLFEPAATLEQELPR